MAGCVLLSTLAVVAVAAAGPAQADSFTWLGPTSLVATGGSRTLPTVSCPSTGQCTTVDGRGEEITFNPSSGAIASRRALDVNGTVASVSCTSGSQCDAVDTGGNEIPFNPTTGALIGAGSRNVDTDQLTSVSCVSGTSCTAVDRNGREVSFNPNSPAVAGPTTIDSTTQLNAVSCVSNPPGAQCAAVDTAGTEVTFAIASNLAESGATTLDIDGSRAVAAVSCASTTVCSAVDGSGYEASFNPSGGGSLIGVATQVDVNNSLGVALHGVSCPSTSQCVAVDSLGNEVTYASAASPAPAVSSVDGTTVLNAVSCPASASSCGAVDNHSHALGFSTSGTAAAAHSIAAPMLPALACPSRTQCSAIDSGSDEVTFDPTTGAINSAGVQAIDTSGNGLTAISCLSTVECTAVDTGGFEVTFDPANGNEIANGFFSLESNPLRSVACQVVSSAAQCTAVDSSGNEVTFNPETSTITPDTPAPVDTTGGALQSVACPSGAQCTAVDSLGNEVTFNPVTGNHYTTQQAIRVDSSSGNNLLSVACPSATQCTAVDQGGYVVTFVNPATAPPSGVVPQDLESLSPSTSLNALACPTASQCTTVDSMGNEATFNPSASNLNATLLTPLGGANSLGGVACQSTSICVAVDAEGNGFSGIQPPVAIGGAPPTISGTAQQSDQLTETNGSWTNFPTGYTYAWQDCTSPTDSTTCSAIPGATAAQYTPVTADVGDYIRVQETASNAGGSGAALSAATAEVTPAPATSSGAPTITSATYFQQGQMLTEHHGAWSEQDLGAPITYDYQWEDCDTSGANCTPSNGVGATTQSYTPNANDVGHRLRVTEVADNGGTPVPPAAASAATSVIEPGPPANTAPPTIVGAAVQQGQTLTDRHGTWTNSGTSTTYAYQWEDCDPSGANCVPISGATGQTYTPTITDVGDTLVVQETAANGGRPVAAPVVSAATTGVLPAPPSNISPPTIAGAIEQGQTLTEGNGLWSSGVDAPTGYSYQWEDCDASGANCARIAGATSPTYTPATSDVGHALVVLETASNSGGNSASVASAPTAPAAPAAAPPIQATSQSAKPVQTNGATIRAQLMTRGLAVSWQFVYGSNTRYDAGSPVESIAAGGPPVVSVSRVLTSLKPDTKYHYRVVETVAAGPYAPAATAYGHDLTFTTDSLGKIVLGNAKLSVSPTGVVRIPLECQSPLTCVDRFSITKTAEIGHGASRHFASVLCNTNVNRVPAGKSRAVSITLTNGCLALLQAAFGHKMSATFTTRPRSGQLGVIRTITLVASPPRKTSRKGA